MSQVGLECKLARNYTMENVERAQALLLVKAIPDKTIDFGVLPLNIVVVIDISGSMSGEKIEFAKEAACLVVDSVSEQDWIAVTVFDDEAQVIVPSRKADDKGAIKSHIRRIETEDGTCMYTGMRAGAREIAKQASRSNLSRMLLLTDGQTVGEDECLDIARREAKNKLVISTFGIGDD